MNLRLSTLAVLILAAPIAVLAQTVPTSAPVGPAGDAPATGRHHGHGIAAAVRSLDLTSAQRTQVDQILADARAKRSAATDPKAKRAVMKDARARIEAVLTPTQLGHLRDELAAMHASRAGAAGATPAP